MWCNRTDIGPVNKSAGKLLNPHAESFEPIFKEDNHVKAEAIKKSVQVKSDNPGGCTDSAVVSTMIKEDIRSSTTKPLKDYRNHL